MFSRSLSTAPAGTMPGAWARAVLFRPSRAASIFWVAGLVAVLSVLPLQHWPHRELLTMLAAAGALAFGAGVRGFAGDYLPAWSLHGDLAATTVIVSVLSAIGADQHVPFAVLYVWVAVFSVVYFRLVAAAAHVAAAGAAYALVLGLSPGVHDPVAVWLAIFGTTVVVATVVLGLVTVLRAEAREDPLTGLANRRAWGERLAEEIERARRAGTAVSVAMIDLDQFKAVNDCHGHETGDRLLQELSATWHGAVRGGGDVLARLGGDEFGLLAPGSDETGILRLVKRLVAAAPESVPCSIGVATWDGEESASELLGRADQAMYRAKRGE